MYVTEYKDHVDLTYISAHTNHDLGEKELCYLRIPDSIKEDVALKLSIGVPANRIIEGD